MKRNLLLFASLSIVLLTGFGKKPKPKGGKILQATSYRHFVDTFNKYDNELFSNSIPNSKAWEWMSTNIPLFDCPDKEMQEIYYFRWWTYRKHIKQTKDGFVVTEFLPKVDWSKAHNTINCAAGHHFYEGRWIHDPKLMDDYARFYFGKGGDPGGTSKLYSNWITDGIYARFLVNADKPFIISLLDSLIKNHRAWGSDGLPGDQWQKSRQLTNGLYWQIDSWEGTEFSIGGTGIRPPINSYLYGSAMAISHIAELAGRKELAKQYLAEARQLQQLIQQQLWDTESKFFKTMRHEKAPIDQYENLSAEKCAPGKLVAVREIFGYVPWYFELPEKGKGYEVAWKQLTDPKGFLAPYGPTTSEQRNHKFRDTVIGCTWDGPSWPFATSQTLVALANVLNNYPQNSIGKKDYFELLTTYTSSQHFKQEDGRIVPWIDESIVPSSGVWGTRKILYEQYPNQKDRGKDYNHSTYCDLIITGLMGLRPRADNKLEVNPLVPDGNWDYFCLDNVLYHGKMITILYDKTGKKYGRGKGLQLFVDGRKVANSTSLQRLIVSQL